ncbi:hypothetical protein ABIE67_004319 [Streptomyces sp. V4I8]
MSHTPRRESNAKKAKTAIRLVVGGIISGATRALIDWLTGR